MKLYPGHITKVAETVLGRIDLFWEDYVKRQDKATKKKLPPPSRIFNTLEEEFETNPLEAPLLEESEPPEHRLRQEDTEQVDMIESSATTSEYQEEDEDLFASDDD